MVTVVPMWVAPNLITVVGLLVNIVTSLIYVYHAPQAKEEVRIPLSSSAVIDAPKAETCSSILNLCYQISIGIEWCV